MRLGGHIEHLDLGGGLGDGTTEHPKSFDSAFDRSTDVNLALRTRIRERDVTWKVGNVASG